MGALSSLWPYTTAREVFFHKNEKKVCTFPFILLKFLSSLQYTFDLLSTLLVHLAIHYDKNQITL